MKSMHVAALALLSAVSFSAVSLADSSKGGAEKSGSAQGGVESLAEKRGGALGKNPEAVTQKGGKGPEAQSGDAGVATLPEGSLAAKRQETIGTPPEPVYQGGGGNAAQKERAEERKQSGQK